MFQIPNKPSTRIGIKPGRSGRGKQMVRLWQWWEDISFVFEQESDSVKRLSQKQSDVFCGTLITFSRQSGENAVGNISGIKLMDLLERLRVFLAGKLCNSWISSADLVSKRIYWSILDVWYDCTSIM